MHGIQRRLRLEIKCFLIEKLVPLKSQGPVDPLIVTVISVNYYNGDNIKNMEYSCPVNNQNNTKD